MGSLATVIIVLAAVLVWAVQRRKRSGLPPGPFGFPIIGNILQLGSTPHQTLANMSKIYGPLMSLQLGSRYTVVVSSPQVAKQVLEQHDHNLCSRSIVSAFEAYDFHNYSLAFTPVGSRWTKIRKLCREHLFSTRRLDESQALRREKRTKLHDYVHECSVAGRALDVGEAVFTTSINLVTATLFSVELATYESDVAHDMKEAVEGMVKIFGSPNVADFFPVFKRIDPQGIMRQSEIYLGKLLEKIENIINLRMESSGDVHSPKKFDLLETLVNLMGDTNSAMSVKDIKYLFLDFFGGTHTTTSTVELAMKELLFNPVKLAKAKDELRTMVGKNTQVEESDICRLPYMQAVIKETLRLHPPAPFLIPRKADYDVQVNGYKIPKNAQILVNVWAIGRDSSIWSNAASFEPERFLNNNVDYKGKNFSFLPFGSGRRICPGMPLADRMLPLVVSTLIHEFDWKLQPGVKPQDGIAVPNTVPLMAIPIKV